MSSLTWDRIENVSTFKYPKDNEISYECDPEKSRSDGPFHVANNYFIKKNEEELPLKAKEQDEVSDIIEEEDEDFSPEVSSQDIM